MKILVIGSGGREHALVWKLAQSPHTTKIYCAPGNAGIAQLADCVPIAAEDVTALLAFAQENTIDLTVVGPEAPLTAGIVDTFQQAGLAIFGPSRKGAELEGSKARAKELMERYGIPTAAYRLFDDVAAAQAYIQEKGAPLVVKADGLAAGKGVVVAMTTEEACQAAADMLSGQAFGEAGRHIVVEEFMAGEEASVLAFSDGKTVRAMLPAQDHKRVGDGDLGPNTGGMGAYAPAPLLTPALCREVEEKILQPTIDAMAKEGHPYKGVVYAGLMLTPDGPKVVEFNARFGDPETQVVLPLLENDLVDLMLAVIDGTLDQQALRWRPGATVCVILAAAGYPGSYQKGKVISGLTATDDDVVVFHAGTAQKDGAIVTNGGRVLGVTAYGADIRQAQQKAYHACEAIQWDGMFYRYDIAEKAFQ
jgi:phosphoribosylamine--glycine ligase